MELIIGCRSLVRMSQKWNHHTDLARTVPLEEIPYIDYPELRINEHESTEMPFRYVKGSNGQPIMPEVRYIRNPVCQFLVGDHS